MKIWGQSCGALGKEASWGAYKDSLEKHLKEVVRPSTTIDLHGTDFTIAGIDRHYSAENICRFQTIRNAIQAEKEGYDGFVMFSTNDAGFYEIRELLNMPAVFITQASIYFASLLGEKFGYVTHNAFSLRRRCALVERYGMAHKMVEGAHLEFSYENFQEMFRNPKPYIETMKNIAQKVVARGAGSILLSPLPLNQWMLDNGLRQIDGANVLDQSGIAVKLAEFMVDLKGIGVTTSRTGSFTPAAPDVQEFLKKLYK